MDVFQTLIVPASVVVQARSAAAETPGCDGMFTTPLSPSGAAPATHYISSGYITEDLVLAIPGLDVSVEPPFEAMDRLGLQMITEGAAADTRVVDVLDEGPSLQIRVTATNIAGSDVTYSLPFVIPLPLKKGRK